MPVYKNLMNLHKKRGFKWIYFEIPLIVRFLKDFAEMFFVLFY